MKNSDVAMIVLIASLSVMIAFFVANSLPFLKVDTQDAKVQTIDEIPKGIPQADQPDPAIFNPEAINPTVKTIIGKDE